MFDPFEDFDAKGYLRNRHAEKDLELIREVEHELFRANLDDAFSYLASRREISYADFLQVHHILFSSLYPWAGTDRGNTAPQMAIQKAATLFCHPQECERTVAHGLRLASNPAVMRDKPGEIMGLFAYGHPFLDGNGRTMLVVHAELCKRAGFAVAWERTNKENYLTHLSQEIDIRAKPSLMAI